MFFDTQSSITQNKYELLLRIIGSLSKLSAESSSVPYLYYRMAENIFCRAFGAKNLSRSDISVDASKDCYGIGLKTFLHKNGQCLEKVAEFNRERFLYKPYEQNTDKLVVKIAELRNKRILSTCGICSLKPENLLYHCVTRDNAKFCLHEENMRLIDIDTINILKVKGNTISFTDKYEEYSFNLSKSTLSKRFNIKPIYNIDVKIIDDPFDLLEKYFSNNFKEDTDNKIIDTIYLPLYSYDKTTHKMCVPEKSGLNQWNAAPRRKRNKNGLLDKGKPRNLNEVYIPVPAKIKRYKPNFFPARGVCFTLGLPNGEFKMAKVCQENDKALMTNPNEDLGKWILRDVLNLKENEIVTYKKLEEIGIDTVQINKFEDNTYEINFKQLGSYENYLQNENI